MNFKGFLKIRKKSNDKLEEAESEGLITKEEKLKLRYERAREDYEDFLIKNKKSKKK